MSNWQPFPASIQLKPDTVYLVGVSATNFNASDKFISSLSQQEREKAARFKFDIHRERYIIFHACLRYIFAQLIQTKPHLLQFEAGPHKKPYLKHHPELMFNLTHSENEAVVAIALHAEIGVDIEKIKADKMNELAERFFSNDEITYLKSVPDDEQAHVFYQLWTHKEAFIKATGLGLSQGLKSFTIGLNPSRLLHADGFNINDWTIQSFSWHKDFAGAFAVPKKVEHVNYYRYDLASLERN